MYTTRQRTREAYDEERSIWRVLPESMRRLIQQILWTGVGICLAGFGLAIGLALASFP